MLKIKWTGAITNDEVFQRAKVERLLSKKKIDATQARMGEERGGV